MRQDGHDNHNLRWILRVRRGLSKLIVVFVKENQVSAHLCNLFPYYSVCRGTVGKQMVINLAVTLQMTRDAVLVVEHDEQSYFNNSTNLLYFLVHM